jgi:hypothetical protein
MIPGELLGTLPQWLTAAGMASLFGLILRWQVVNRKLGIERMSAASAAELGVGSLYAAEVQALRARLDSQSERFSRALSEMEARNSEALAEQERRHQAAIAASEERHEDCLKDRDSLRGEVSVLRNEINGLIRVITQASIDRVVMLGDSVSIDVKEAAARAQEMITQGMDPKDIK